MSSCVTRSRLVHARAFLSCQASVFFFAPFDGLTLSLFFSRINGVFGNACRLSVAIVYQRATRRPSRGIYESSASPKRCGPVERLKAASSVRSLPPGGLVEGEKQLIARETRAVKMPPYDFSIGPDVTIMCGRADKSREGRR